MIDRLISNLIELNKHMKTSENLEVFLFKSIHVTQYDYL